MPSFDIAYGTDSGCGIDSCSEEMLIIENCFYHYWSFFPNMCFNAPLVQRNALFKLTSITSFQSFNVASLIFLEVPLIPTLLTKTSIRPNRLIASSISALQVFS
jgi:hypothetical protein